MSLRERQVEICFSFPVPEQALVCSFRTEEPEESDDDEHMVASGGSFLEPSKAKAKKALDDLKAQRKSPASPISIAQVSAAHFTVTSLAF